MRKTINKANCANVNKITIAKSLKVGVGIGPVLVVIITSSWIVYKWDLIVEAL